MWNLLFRNNIFRILKQAIKMLSAFQKQRKTKDYSFFDFFIKIYGHFWWTWFWILWIFFWILFVSSCAILAILLMVSIVPCLIKLFENIIVMLIFSIFLNFVHKSFFLFLFPVQICVWRNFNWISSAGSTLQTLTCMLSVTKHGVLLQKCTLSLVWPKHY